MELHMLDLEQEQQGPLKITGNLKIQINSLFIMK